jgi:hypothetical protein
MFNVKTQPAFIKNLEQRAIQEKLQKLKELLDNSSTQAFYLAKFNTLESKKTKPKFYNFFFLFFSSLCCLRTPLFCPFLQAPKQLARVSETETSSHI